MISGYEVGSLSDAFLVRHMAWWLTLVLFGFALFLSPRNNYELAKLRRGLYYVVSIVVFFIYVEVLGLFLPLFVGEEYLLSMEFVPLVVLGYAVLNMYSVVAGYLYHDGRTITLAVVTILSALLNIMMNFVLIPLGGAIRAAQAALIAFVFLFLVIKLIVVRSCDMPWIGAFR